MDWMAWEWMAWTGPTALFFVAIAASLGVMTLLQRKYPSIARTGALGIETTRGDRLFITLLGSAFINLAWIGLLDTPQYGALAVCGLYAFCVFRWV
jgi:predicted small integral membrane protein